ncbi:DUF4838 domain-containing protein [Daejeonella sp.]|uniref:DUF4838 domain-containing protein n=1 Tax=Daejeonella sp. TaxID=2805397 RepID=UPI0030BD2F1C
MLANKSLSADSSMTTSGIRFFVKAIGLLCLISLIVSNTAFAAQRTIIIHSKGTPKFDVVIPENESTSQKFAGLELVKYLQKLTGSTFKLLNGANGNKPSIILRNASRDAREAYNIRESGNSLILEGNSDAAVLYAVYDFLERLGCVWLAPDFDHYKGKAEIIPLKKELSFNYNGKISETPALEYRKLDVAGARNNTVENLRQLIEWMPKVRYNTLRLQMGKAKWEKWSADLTPGMKKRGVSIEVGGHGYQNFLNAGMEGGTLFKRNPEWFGKDSTCNYNPSDRLVFNTEDPEAVDYFLTNVVNYLKSHPEIEIFDLWPPDVGRWADCPDWKKYGTAQDRQIRLTNKLNAAVKRAGLDVKIEIIAYSFALFPSDKEVLDKDVLVEICPIDQSFEYQINDPSAPTNAEYVKAIMAWRKSFPGNISFYSYYRKQAWRSLANIGPHYLQKDMQWIKSVPMSGISCYAEQGDWFSYELNHYTLAKLAWDPGINVDSLSAIFYKNRYGKKWETARNAYQLIEKTVPVYGSIPFSTLKSPEAIKRAQNSIHAEMARLRSASEISTDPEVKANFVRLLLVFEYIRFDLNIQHSRAAAIPKEQIFTEVRKLVDFLEANAGKGVVILTGNNDYARFTKKYGLTNQSLLD